MESERDRWQVLSRLSVVQSCHWNPSPVVSATQVAISPVGNWTDNMLDAIHAVEIPVCTVHAQYILVTAVLRTAVLLDTAVVSHCTEKMTRK